jgi:hypothetical protein
MLKLNDFSGGLNTKSSPRDIAFNQVQLSTNVVLSNPGVITSSKDADDKTSGTISKDTTSNYGNGAFIYNHEFDINSASPGATARQIIAYPDGANMEFMYRNFDTTGDFSDAGATNAFAVSSGNFEPVYYYVDGVLYIGDKDRVDTSGSFTQKSIQLVNKDRFSETVSAIWVSGDSGPVATTDAIFEAIENESSVSITTPSATGEFRLGFNSNPTQSSLSAFQGGGEDVKLTVAVETNSTQINASTDSGTANISSLFPVGTYIYLGSEIMRVNYAPAGTTSLLIPVDRGAFGTTPGEHSIDDVLEKSTDEPIGTGAWPEGIYEFSYSIVDYGGNETLPHVFSTALDSATIAAGQFFDEVDIKFNTESTFPTARAAEKGVRIYTRIKDSNDRYILFLDVDYERGARRNLFEEFEPWDSASGYNTASAVADLANPLRILSPALDTYESINGYAQEEKSVSLGTKGGYKAAAVCARRAWIANVRKDDIVYDDRIYYSPVNRFATFPDSYFLDIGISDGDSFTALHSLGNRLLAFKQKKLYVINVSSTSDSGWYLEAEYEGVGCRTQESVCKTPFGVCWINDDGVYIFDGSSQPVELSLLLDDNTFRSNAGSRPTIGYNSKYKQLAVCQDTSATDDFLIYDFQTKGWSVTQSMVNGMSNFLQTSDGLYFIEYASSGNNKAISLLSGDSGINQIDLKTKDIDFDNPGRIKKVYKVYVTAKDDGGAGDAGNTLTLKYALNGSTTFGNATTATPNSSTYTTLVYTLNVDCESIAFQLTDEASETISINDITIEYREKYKRAS